MKLFLSLFIVVLITKDYNSNKESIATSPEKHIEKAYSKNDNVNQAEHPSEIYFVEYLEGKNITDLMLSITLDEKSKTVSGFSGCNHYSGGYTIKSNSISFSQLITTRMYCENTQEIEDFMLECLSKINSFLLDGNRLILKNGETDLLIAQKQSKQNSSDNFIIEYTALSRGLNHMIEIVNKTISIQKDSDSKPKTKNCSNEEWTKIVSLFKLINLNSLSTLEAPTEARFYDGAAIANLKITYEGEIFETAGFDHGNPPKEIEALVKEILSISENID